MKWGEFFFCCCSVVVVRWNGISCRALCVCPGEWLVYMLCCFCKGAGRGYMGTAKERPSKCAKQTQHISCALRLRDFLAYARITKPKLGIFSNDNTKTTSNSTRGYIYIYMHCIHHGQTFVADRDILNVTARDCR